MLYSICVRTLTLKFLTLSRSDERMRFELCTHLVLAHILLKGTLFSLNIGKYISHLPGGDDKRDPERESWPCSLMQPILPIQSISGSRLSSPPGMQGWSQS